MRMSIQNERNEGRKMANNHGPPHAHSSKRDTFALKEA